jgi:hypothetical protein
MSKQTMTIIDPTKLRAFVDANDPAQVTKALGKARYYFKNIYTRGEMPTNVLTALCTIYGIDPSDVTPDAPEQDAEFCQFEITPVEKVEDTEYIFETEIRDGEYGQILYVTMHAGDKRYTAKSFFVPNSTYSFACAMRDALDVIATLIDQDDLR